jgi:hypothetical protein
MARVCIVDIWFLHLSVRSVLLIISTFNNFLRFHPRRRYVAARRRPPGVARRAALQGDRVGRPARVRVRAPGLSFKSATGLGAGALTGDEPPVWTSRPSKPPAPRGTGYARRGAAGGFGSFDGRARRCVYLGYASKPRGGGRTMNDR